MFKKIEIWILYLLLIGFIVFLILFSSLLRHELRGGNYFPKLQKIALFMSQIPHNLKEYILTTNDPGYYLRIRDDRHKNKKNFIRYSFKERDELLLLSRFNGDKSRSTVELVNLNDFSILHSWEPDFNKIIELTDKSKEEYKNLEEKRNENNFIIINPLVLENGDMIFNGTSPLVKVNFCSDIVWINDNEKFHHSNNIDHEGNYWVPSTKYPYDHYTRLIGEKFGTFDNDAITKISSDGKILYQKSIVEIFKENSMSKLLFSKNFYHDPIHLNDIEPVLEDGPFWKKGDLFLSIREQSMIILFRPSSNKILNILQGPFNYQHDVDILSKEKILIFNNNTFSTYKGLEIFKNNELVAYNFKNKKYSKVLNNQMIENEVRTPEQGLQVPLKDGSIMVEENNSGRLLFFNSEKKLEWEYVNRAENQNTYYLGWSRIIEDKKIIANLKKLSDNKKCVK